MRKYRVYLVEERNYVVEIEAESSSKAELLAEQGEGAVVSKYLQSRTVVTVNEINRG